VTDGILAAYIVGARGRAGDMATWAGRIDVTQIVASQTDRIVWRTRSIVYADGTQVVTAD
jgi:hypothetical protein